MKSSKLSYRIGLGTMLVAGPAWAAEASASLFGDNLLVLGVVAAVVIFAFIPKGRKSTPSVSPAPAPSDPPSAVDPPPAEPEPLVEASEESTGESAAPAAAEEPEPASAEVPAESEQKSSENVD